MPELKLFFKHSCPFCRKVLNFMESNNITIPLADIASDSETRQELIEKGGKQQVPCLMIDGQPMYESDNIIAWIRKERVES